MRSLNFRDIATRSSLCLRAFVFNPYFCIRTSLQTFLCAFALKKAQNVASIGLASFLAGWEISGSRIRTDDAWIMIPLLYQLSYAAAMR